MKKNRLIFYAVFAVFHLVSFVFTILIQDFSFLTRIYGYIPSFKYFAFFGLVLVAVDIIWTLTSNRNLGKEKSVLQNELNTLKAKLFDLQEELKRASLTKPEDKRPS